MQTDYTLSVNDSLDIHMPLNVVKQMVVNFDDCLKDGRLPAGTTWFKVDETIKPCTITEKKGGITVIHYDGKYTVKALGGYEWGGRGCFYDELKKEAK